MNKKSNVSNRRYSHPGRKLPTVPFAAETPISHLTFVGKRYDLGTAETIERIQVDTPPRLSPTLADILPMPDVVSGRDNVRRKVIMLGLRGVPNIQGGVEKHVEMLAQELVVRGWDVEVVARRHYLSQHLASAWRGMRIVPLWAPKSMVLEAFFHTLLGVLYAAWQRPDILHIHAIGPALLAPFARLMGLKVVVTHHGYDYERDKWRPFAKKILRLGEKLGMKFASQGIAVSKDVAETMKGRYGRDVAHIPNGVVVKPSLMARVVLDRFGLQRQRYIIMVARFVPEKRQTDLIAAFEKLGNPDWKLLLVGCADHCGTAYARQIEAMAALVPGVVLAGFQTGDALAALFSQAGLFVLPSVHEGMPIALLEAMSYGLPVLASDIAANHEVGLPDEDYFPATDVDALAASLARKIAEPLQQETALARIRQVEQGYTWPSISRQTITVYKQAAGDDNRKARS